MLISTVPNPVTTRQRQRTVADLVRHGVQKPSEVYAELVARGMTNKRGVPFSLSTIRNDLKTTAAGTVSEIIGRTVTATPFWKLHAAKSVDATQTDYEFWDQLRRGKADGFAFGALFAMPLTEIVASFVLGSGVSAALVDSVEGDAANVEYTNQQLGRFMSRHHRLLHLLAKDLYGLGDQYAAINPDSSVSVISPDLVTITPDPLDYRTYQSLKVETKLDTATVTDTYRVDGRTVTIQQIVGGRTVTVTHDFENLIGTLPIIHFPNDRGTNELYGRPIYEALYRLMSRYDDLIEKAIDGVELMGNPVPVFEGMENIDETINANKTQDDETYTDAEGNDETRTMLRFDRLMTIWVGKGGSFNFKSPNGGFTDDVRNMLKMLFLLMLDYTRVPEAVWGGAINSSKASADAQMPPFFQYIESRRLALEGDGADAELGLAPKNGLYELLDVWLKTRALTDPRIVVGPCEIKWPKLSESDWRVLLEWTQFLRGMGLLDDETTLEQFGQVDDPAAVLEQARKEADERKAQQEDEFNRRLKAEQDAANANNANDQQEGRDTANAEENEAGQESSQRGIIDRNNEPATQAG